MRTIDDEYMSDNRTICPRHDIPHVGFGCPMCGAEARRAMAMANEDNARRAFIHEAAMRAMQGILAKGTLNFEGYAINTTYTPEAFAAYATRCATALWDALQENEKK